MKDHKVYLLVIILICLIFCSCSSQTTEAINAVSVSTEPYDFQTPTATNTLQLTETIYPTNTPETDCEMVATPTPERRIVRDGLSPNRRWRAFVILEFVDGEERSIFYVVNDEAVIWIVEDIPYVDIHVSGFPFPEPFYWTTNGQYLYFTHQSSGDGCFAGGRHRGTGLLRLDLATGNVVELSPNFASWMSISPDEKTLAYFNYSRQGLTFRDLDTGNERTLDRVVLQEDVGMELDYRYIVWSPDSQSLVFVVMAGVCDFIQESYFNWLVHVNLISGVQTILFEKDERGFVPIAWPDINKVLIRQGSGQLLWLNPTTGDIEPEQ